MTSVVKEVEDLVHRIETTGMIVDNTKEIRNVVLSFNDTTHDDQVDLVYEYFKENRMDFQAKLEQEATHYQFLKYGLLQKIKYNRFYFNEEPINSRKLYLHSPDCISLIQILPRATVMQVNVYMRSSEAKCLLPIDILGILDICDALKWMIYVNISTNPKTRQLTLIKQLYTQLSVWIASAHTYLKGDPRRENILKGIH